MGVVVLVVLFLAIFVPIFHHLSKNARTKNLPLPPGSMGLPIVGQSIGLLRAMRANRAEEWLGRRIEKHGPISRLSLFGKPTVFVSGPAAHRLVFADAEGLGPHLPGSMMRILGKRTMMGLTGDDHRRVRAAVGQFLRPEILKRYVGKMDGEVRRHLELNWVGRPTVKVLPLMKQLTFDIICSLMFGLERGPLREGLVKDFVDMVEGMWVVPVNLPFTRFNKGLRASRRARRLISGLIRDKRRATMEEEKNENGSISDDLIGYLISLEGGEESSRVTEEEIIEN